MSKVINDKGIRPGSIYRISLKNFVTYKEVELFPGPSLNVIIGPNGTGKSTFVCAIILGLCGKTSFIGRAKKISDYVRGHCQEAKIEIELYQKRGEHNIIITRTIDLKDMSTWSIDHQIVQEKKVKDLIATMNIQVDNFCQFLPQDRVKDFAKMNPQQLLRSTLAAVGGQRSVSQLDELIKCREEQRTASTRLQNNAQHLEEQVRLNERLKYLIDAMRERQEIEYKIQMCEKKKLWFEYDNLFRKVMEYRNDMSNKTNESKKLTDIIEPLANETQQARNVIRTLEQQRSNANRDLHYIKDKVKEYTDSVRHQEYSIKDLEKSFLEKLERYKSRAEELQKAKAVLDKLHNDRAILVDRLGDENQVKGELTELNVRINRTIAAVDKLKKQRLDIQYDLEINVKPQITLYENKIRSVQDVYQKRLQALRTKSEDAYRAVEWLQQNRHMFKHAVYAPMMLEINFTNPNFARYLEFTVPVRDLVAFTFESSDDMNLFLKKVRQEGGLRTVNAVCSSVRGWIAAPYTIEQLHSYGFYTYLVNTITAPEAIIHYLCRLYNIHKIPIGTDYTYKYSSQVPADIRLFFTENHRFSVKISRYSGAMSTSTVEVRPARLLANIVDNDQLTNFNNQLSNYTHILQVRQANMQEIDTRLQQLEMLLNKDNSNRKNVTDCVQKVRTISTQIRLQHKQVEEINNEPEFDIQSERDRCKRKQRDCVLKQCRLHEELLDLLRSLQDKALKAEMWKFKLYTGRNAVAQQEIRLRELRNELHNVQLAFQNIQVLHERCKERAKEKFIEAKRSCNNKVPSRDPDFPYVDVFLSLPDHIDTLQALCIELQAKIDCMEVADENVTQEHKNREKIIARLRLEMNDASNIEKRLLEHIDKIKSEWLPRLEELLRVINQQFGHMFNKMDCAGKVELDMKGGADDFVKYGVAILVRFRSTEQLQQLTRQTQSGGERALSTALYLMALQRMTTVPFRCVDEINQGMDAIFERKMFQLLVKATTETDNAQYFLLTPKLLPNLEYTPDIIVHTIMNGKNILNNRDWKIQKFVEKARLYRQ